LYSEIDSAATVLHNHRTSPFNEKEWIMQTVDLDTTDCFDAAPGLSVAFPLHSATGAADSAIVWINLEPGGELPSHQDSAEELLLVIEGEVEATVDGETGTLGERQMALVPPMAPHGMRNVGDRPARVVGFFSASTVVSTFAEPMGPGGPQLFVTGAPAMIAVPLEEPVAV
jgi:quercetin dioxygenase-like cupin family protein